MILHFTLLLYKVLKVVFVMDVQLHQQNVVELEQIADQFYIKTNYLNLLFLLLHNLKHEKLYFIDKLNHL